MKIENENLPPAFPGDDHAALRSLQHAGRIATMAGIFQKAANRYFQAWRVLGGPDDVLYDALKRADMVQTISIAAAHDHLAAYWRAKTGHVQPEFETIFPLEDAFWTWQRWVFSEVDAWAMDRPHLIRMLCRVIVQKNTLRDPAMAVAFNDEILDAYRIDLLPKRDAG